jgi:hypothetical protein
MEMSISQFLKFKKEVTTRGDVRAGDETLVVRVERKETPCVELSAPPSRADCVRLVGLSLAQACRDGSSLVRLGYDAATKQTWLRNELHSHPGQRWEMVPIPPNTAHTLHRPNLLIA